MTCEGGEPHHEQRKGATLDSKRVPQAAEWREHFGGQKGREEIWAVTTVLGEGRQWFRDGELVGSYMFGKVGQQDWLTNEGWGQRQPLHPRHCPSVR